MNYRYTASLVRAGLWMVKRYSENEVDGYKESLIEVDTVDSAAAIAAAVERGSWG